MTPSRSHLVEIRGLPYHVRSWGDADAPPLVLLHGWMDVSASFQFLVDALAGRWHCLAPDWRGFGLSGWAADGYWFPDYLADLEALLDALARAAPVPLVGHSMGGNIACLYAGVRPARVSHVVSLEGFGLAPTRPDEAPGRYARWLDELKTVPEFSHYPSPDAVKRRLQKNNPRLRDEQAAFLARHWAQVAADGAELRSDPRHKRPNPVLYRLEEAMACWRRIAAPVLFVRGAESPASRLIEAAPEAYAERTACFARLREEVLADAGHMLHHDQPLRLAQAIERFLGS
ncbi:MAG TPA: alpha/beta hydrolase [Pelomicrobium sp.]|nr:alpha/beta hydrolase [Pelomicrobium sp.]